MDNTQWLLIILLVLLIAVGIWMLTRKPASGQDRSPAMGQDEATDQTAGADGAGVSNYDAGGAHVAAGETGVAPGPALYDQETDPRTEGDVSTAGYDDAGNDQVSPDEMWNEADSTEHTGARQDTATGADVPVVEEEPVVSEDHDVEAVDVPFDQHDQDSAAYPVEQSDPFVDPEHGDRDQMSYGDPQVEDFASETTYADAPVEGTLEPVADAPAEPNDLGSASPGTSVHDEMLDLENEQALRGQEFEGGETVHRGAGSENVGPEEGEGDAPLERDPDQGHPGPVSQQSDEATYTQIADHGAASENLGPEEGEGETPQERDPDQGHPGPSSQVGEEDASYGIPAEASAEEHDDVPEDAAAAGFVADDYEAMDEHPAASDPADFAVEDGRVVDDADQVGEPVEAEQTGGEDSQAVMVDVDDYSATQAPESDSHDSHDGGSADTGHDPEPDLDAERNDKVAQSGVHDSAEQQHGHQEPQAVMVDVDDYSATTESSEAGAPADDGTQQDVDAHGSTSLEQRDKYDAGDVAASDIEQEPIVVEDEPVVGDDERMVVESEEAAEPAVVASPYGPGSVFPDDDGAVPEGYAIKGNAGSMLFHTTESPSYENCVPEVYFDSEDAARAAGFAHWDRKRR